MEIIWHGEKIGQAQLFIRICPFTHRLHRIESAAYRMKTPYPPFPYGDMWTKKNCFVFCSHRYDVRIFPVFPTSVNGALDVGVADDRWKS